MHVNILQWLNMVNVPYVQLGLFMCQSIIGLNAITPVNNDDLSQFNTESTLFCTYNILTQTHIDAWLLKIDVSDMVGR